LEVEQRELFTEEDFAALEEKILLEEEIIQAQAQKEADRKIEERNKFLEDEITLGTNLAKAKAIFRTEELKGVKSANNQLIALTQSKNDTLKGIGKAAASVNAAIATGEGAIKAYTSLAGIPIVGPALGAAAAGALIAFGVEQQGKILAANTGGLVPSNLGRAGVDSVPASLTPGEVVVPTQNFDELINSTAASRGFTNPDEEGTGSQGGMVTVALEPKGDFIDFIEQKIVEARIQNTGIL